MLDNYNEDKMRGMNCGLRQRKKNNSGDTYVYNKNEKKKKDLGWCM